MLEQGALPSSPEAIDAVKAYLRLDGADEDAILDGLLATAVVQCEAAIGRTLIARTMRETIGASTAWMWLHAGPVQSIVDVKALTLDGIEFAVAVSSYAFDIDADGRGRVRFLALPAAARAIVTYRAGASADWAALPIAVRQGIIELTANHYAARETATLAAIPAAVAQMWASERRVRL